MKEVVTIKSNAFYVQKESNDTFELQPFLELVIVHTDGKLYELRKGRLVSGPNVVETRMLINPEMLAGLITDLKMHEKKLQGVRANADKLNGLVKFLQDEDLVKTTDVNSNKQ